MKKLMVLGAAGVLSFAIGTTVFAADFAGRCAGGTAGHRIHQAVCMIMAENSMRQVSGLVAQSHAANIDVTVHNGAGSCSNYADTDYDGICDNCGDGYHDGVCDNYAGTGNQGYYGNNAGEDYGGRYAGRQNGNSYGGTRNSDSRGHHSGRHGGNGHCH